MPGVSGSPHVPPWPAPGLPAVVGGPRPWRGCLTSTVEYTPPLLFSVVLIQFRQAWVGNTAGSCLGLWGPLSCP